MQKSFIREEPIDLNESTSLMVNADQGIRINRKRLRYFLRKIFSCISWVFVFSTLGSSALRPLKIFKCCFPLFIRLWYKVPLCSIKWIALSNILGCMTKYNVQKNKIIVRVITNAINFHKETEVLRKIIVWRLLEKKN